MKRLVEFLIESTDWQAYEDIDGPAVNVARGLTALLESANAEEAEAAYWQLENRIVVQGNVYSVCVPAVRILVASLLNDCGFPVRVAVLDLLYQILSGSSVSEDPFIIERCRAYVAEGTWLIVREFVFGPRDAARDVLHCLRLDLDFESLASIGVH